MKPENKSSSSSGLSAWPINTKYIFIETINKLIDIKAGFRKQQKIPDGFSHKRDVGRKLPLGDGIPEKTG